MIFVRKEFPLPISPFMRRERIGLNRFFSQATDQGPSRIREWWDKGNILIGIGSAGLALLVFDRYLQYTDRQDASNMVQFIKEEQRVKRKQLFEQYKDAPTKFYCVVRERYQMGGTHGLKGNGDWMEPGENKTKSSEEGVHVGDILEVLEEGVGPDGHYNMCRKRDESSGRVVSVGWYPIAYMEKHPGKRWWRFW